MSAAPRSNVVPFPRADRRRREKAAARTLEELYRADLARSGIAPQLARKLGFQLCDADEAWKHLRPKRPERPSDFTAEGYCIPYFDAHGKRTSFFRFRKLRGKFSADDDGTQRYAQPLNSKPHLYVPWPILGLAVDAATGKVRFVRLGLTEGEKKAIAASVILGFPFVALGGVDSFQSRKHGIVLVEEFRAFDLTRTDIEVVYDSDVYNNPDVDSAARRLSDAVRRDMSPRSLRQKRLTSENAGAKTGLDDFLVSFPNPAAARGAYDALESINDPISEAFARFNDEIVHVKRQTKYFNALHGTWYPSQKQVAEEYARGTPVQDPASGKPIYAISKWFAERPPSTEVLDVDYAPGKSARYRDDLDPSSDVLNKWRPSNLAPAPFRRLLQVREYIEFVEYLTASLTDGERAWLLDWTAYPLQNLGAKIRSAVLIWSNGQGTGKNTYSRILKPMYGEQNCHEIDGATLVSQFNGWAQKQFVIINEVRMPSYNERAAVLARMKTLVTEPTIDLEEKYLARRNVRNHANFFLTSNDHDALSLESDDRRFFIIQGPDASAKWPAEKFRALNGWLDAGGTESAFGFLLKRNLKNFDPFAEPPRTEARASMLVGSQSALDDLVTILMETPVRILSAPSASGHYQRPGRDLFLPHQVIESLSAYAASHGIKAKLTLGTLRAALGKRNVVKRAFEIKTKGNRDTATAYALFNAERWQRASDGEWRAHILERNPGLFQ